jgi:hypothetical protein
MKFTIRQWARVALVVAVGALSFSCSNEFTRSASPVELVATNVQDLQLIDLAGDPPGDEACQRDIGTIALQAIIRNPIEGQNQAFNTVRVTRYRVSYVRTDGGTLVPAPFVRSMDLLLEPGSAGDVESFVVFQPDALFQAPFAALFTGTGRDPETGREFIRMDVIMDFFGETLAGENVSSRTRFTLDFCVTCGGCSPKE